MSGTVEHPVETAFAAGGLSNPLTAPQARPGTSAYPQESEASQGRLGSRRRLVSRRHRTPEGAGAEHLTGGDLTSRPVGEVRRFGGRDFPFLATQVAPGRWMLHGRSLGVDALDGLASVRQEPRPGASGGWSQDRPTRVQR